MARTALHVLQPEHAPLYLQLDELKEHFIVPKTRLLFQKVGDLGKGPYPIGPVLQRSA